MSDPTHDDPRRLFAGFEAVPIEIRVRVGAARCRLARMMAMKPGEVLRLDRTVGEPFELISDDCVLARVEPVADDERVALKMVEVAEEEDDGTGA